MISTMPKWLGNLFSNALRPNMQVISIVRLSPQLKRIRFRGDLSKMNMESGYAHVIRVSETEYRNYTAAYYNKQEGLLDIIFHIHGTGPGSAYADNLEVGDEIFISSPRGKKAYDAKAGQHIVFGDETVLGLACSLLPVLAQGGHACQFYFELEAANKEVPGLLGFKNYTVFNKNESFRNRTWIAALPLFQENDIRHSRFVLAGNVKSVLAFREALKTHAVTNINSQGYWLEGKTGL